MKLMYIDESGDHNLDPKKVDKSYPIFVLCGCVFDEEYYQKIVLPEFNALKVKFFGSDNIILHTLEMTRPTKSKDKRFLKLIDKTFRHEFYAALNKFISDIDLMIVACAIKKLEHIERYDMEAMDPYLLSFDNLLNRFIFEIPNQKGIGKIIAEKRNSVQDNQLELAWLNTKINGTKFIQGAEIKEKIENLYMVPKSRNDAGLQIADLIASPVGRYLLGLKREPGNDVSFEVLKDKFSNKNGKVLDYGLTVLPKK